MEKNFINVFGVRICTKPELNLQAILESGDWDKVFNKDPAAEAFENLPVEESLKIIEAVNSSPEMVHFKGWFFRELSSELKSG